MDEMWRWFKRSGIVHGERLQSAWRWKTSSGNVMQAEPGDWRLWDSKDPEHRWSITPCELELTYRQVAPGVFERTGSVEARPAHPGEVVATLEGNATARDGDWVIRSGEATWVVSPTLFAERYQPARDPRQT